jgi:hypothetical protein
MQAVFPHPALFQRVRVSVLAKISAERGFAAKMEPGFPWDTEASKTCSVHFAFLS